MIDAALELAERGLAVFPCRERGKMPLTSDGFHAASRDPEQIRMWWAKWPSANIGVACGASNLVVLDVDPRHDGDESLAVLRAALGEGLTETVTVLTGGGGQHLYFRAPTAIVKDNNTGALGPGLDVKSAGGYVIAAPSVHESGREYAWEVGYGLGEVALQVLPDAIIQRLMDGAKPQAPQLGTLELIPAGKRDSTLASIAGTMRRRGLSYDEILAALVAVNERRCKPPLPESDLQRIATSISRYEPQDPLAAPGDRDKREVDHSWLGLLTCAAEIRRKVIPPVEFDVDGILESEDGPVLIFGDAGIGKSWLALFLAASILNGKPFLGYSTRARPFVLYLNFDGGRKALQRRVARLGIDDDRFIVMTARAWDWAAFEELLERHPRAFVVIDCLAAVFSPDPAKDVYGAQTRAFIDTIRDLLEKYGANGAILDHAKRTTGPRNPTSAGVFPVDYIGSNQKKATCRTMWAAECVADENGDPSRSIQVRSEKVNEAAPFPPFRLSFDFRGELVTIAEESTAIAAPGHPRKHDAIAKEYAAQVGRALAVGGPFTRRQVWRETKDQTTRKAFELHLNDRSFVSRGAERPERFDYLPLSRTRDQSCDQTDLTMVTTAGKGLNDEEKVVTTGFSHDGHDASCDQVTISPLGDGRSHNGHDRHSSPVQAGDEVLV